MNDMELVDYIAIKAMQSLIVVDDEQGSNACEHTAKVAYSYARAMLREKENAQN